MTIIDILRRARKNLAQAKTRTVLTSLAIAVGAFTITMAMAAGAGGRQYTEEMMSTSGDAYSLYIYPKTETVDNNGPSEYGVVEDSAQTNALNKTDIEKIKAIDGVVDVTVAYSIQPQYVTRGDNFKKYVIPVSIKVDRTEMKLAAGSLDDNSIPIGGAVVSEDFIASLGFTDAKDAIGKSITINFPKVTTNGEASDESIDKVFKIVAVDHKTDATLYYQPMISISSDDGGAIYNYQMSGAGSDQYYLLIAELKKGTDVKATQASISNKNYEVYSLQDTRETLLQMVNIAQWGMVAFGALVILASIFGIINTQYISVLERTQQIGLMKALGAGKRDISRLFRYEAAWVGFLGGMIGTILALCCSFFNPIIDKVLGLSAGVKLLVFEPLTSIVLILSMMLIAVSAGYFPARKASKLNPIEALRTE